MAKCSTCNGKRIVWQEGGAGPHRTCNETEIACPDCEGMVEVVCAGCQVHYDIPVEEDPGDELWFCEDRLCVSAAFRYHVGGPF